MTTGSLGATHLTGLTTALAGRYRLERELGAGGMATVWLAEDLRHARRVAIKVLHPELSAVLGPERFLAEIKTTAKLQHPHILPLFDSGSAEGLLYYVMPYVEGETLRARLERERQLPVADAVRLATEVADALDYAHRRGVIHRDVKPENVLLHDGRAVVADFGIALAVQHAGGQRMTQTGLSLGTPQYMAPEQAMGERTVDARADVYALGAVTYEMLVGEPPFTGPTVQAIVARVLTAAPAPPTQVRGTVPAHVEQAVLTALAKLPADRFATAREFADALRAGGTSGATRVDGNARTAAPRGASRRTTRVLGAALVAAGALAAWGWLRPAEPRPVLRYAVALDSSEALIAGGRFGRLALSPDGSMLVYVGGPRNALMLRRRDELRAKEVPGTENSGAPQFSPDGRRVAFIQNASVLKVASLDGSPPFAVTDSAFGLAGLSWGDDDMIYMDGRDASALVRVAARAGATPERFASLDTAAGEGDQHFPHVLPGAERILFTSAPAPFAPGRSVVVLDRTTGTRHVVVERATRAVYAASGHLVYSTVDGNLMAAPFDLASARVTGDPTLIGQGLARVPLGIDFTVSRTGTLAYAAGATAGEERELVWVGRDGRAEPVDSTWRAPFTDPALSPDGRSLAVSTAGSPGETVGDVWIRRLDTGALVKLSVEPGVHRYPGWSRDGTMLTYTSAVGIRRALVQRPADGSAPASTRLADPGLSTWDASPDGQWLVYATGRPRVLYARRASDTASTPLFPGESVTGGRLSPDGRWIAYVTGATQDRLPKVYVSPFPNTSTAKWLVSPRSGQDPVWSTRGTELFYRDLESQAFVAVPVSTAQTFSFGPPRALFPAAQYAQRFAVAPGDSRFLMVRREGAAAQDRLTFVENWVQALPRRR